MSLTGRPFLAGVGLSLVTTAVLSVVMVPFRAQLGTATSALVLVVPVVMGVATGGFAAGVVAVGLGFVAYDVLFIPPYGTLALGTSRDWVALGVYAAVMLVVARVVAALSATRAEARRREKHVRRLFELSELVVGEQNETDLLERVVTAVRDVFGMSSVVLLLARGDELVRAATAGEPWSAAALTDLVPRAGVPVPAQTARGGTRALALAATGAPLGLLGLQGPPLAQEDQELLRVFANHAALSLERARLREQTLHMEVLEETERLQKALMGAVSHDLRTPLATIKVSASTLIRANGNLDDDDRHELLSTIDTEADRLGRLVTNLLDMTRVQAGALRVMEQPVAVTDLVAEALAPLEPLLTGRPLTVSVPEDLPLVLADPVLIGQVLVNLVENAARHSPEGTAVVVSAAGDGEGRVVLSVTDDGPGLKAGGDEVFEPFHGAGPGRGTGVGLSIAKSFVEVHGHRIWAEDVPGGGARFCFTLSVLATPCRNR